jgi:predicted acetyltransferase
MKVEVSAVPKPKKAIIAHLLQLYLYEFSELEGFDVGRDGLFRYGYLNSYWEDATRFPFLISVDTHIAGFVLVNSITYAHTEGGARSVAEFFILRKYRRRGVGRAAAFHIFGLFPGKWEVREIESNVAGQRFWRKIISEYTDGDFKEVSLNNEFWQGPAQIFNSAGWRKPTGR